MPGADLRGDGLAALRVEIDIRCFERQRAALGPAREMLKDLYKHKNENVLNSAGNAWG